MVDFEFLPEEEDDPEPIEPGTPSIENVAFVLLGALATIAVIYHVVTLFG